MSARREVEQPFPANWPRIFSRWLLDLKQHSFQPDAEKAGLSSYFEK